LGMEYDNCSHSWNACLLFFPDNGRLVVTEIKEDHPITTEAFLFSDLSLENCLLE
jgi:hypothetical protein